MRYIGSKVKLLDEIQGILDPHLNGDEKTFVDLFAGSNSVGKFFKNRFEVISNDLMYFSYVIAKANIELNEAPKFDKLKKNQGINDPLKFLQTQSLEEYSGGFVTETYSPAGKDGRMYFTEINAKRIDFARNTIDEWFNNDQITESEMFYLLDALIQAVPFVSNITGTYGAYLKHWDKRAFKSLELIPSSLVDNGRSNKAYNQDSNTLVKNIKGDILYIDTPYNNRQYAPNYHVLETIARNDYPEVHGVTGQRDSNKLKSDFAMKSRAKEAMKNLLQDLNFSHVVISYSTDGIIPEAELMELIQAVAKNGIVEEKRIAYRKYKSKVVNPKDELYELLFYFQPKRAKFEDTGLKKNKIIRKNKISKTSVNGGFIKSPLNYIGGKYKLLPQLFPLFPKNVDIFVDLFSGGGNVGINVNADKIYFNDLNVKINEMFRYFQGKDPDELLTKINSKINEYGLSKTNEQAFLKFRSDYNKQPNPLDLYTLVAFSFNYQFRFNNDMKYNNPFGRNRSHFSERMANNLTRFVTRLNNIDATFTDDYFTKFDTSILTPDSFVYADPPYLITTGSYNDGNRGFVNWTSIQEQELYDFLDGLNDRDIKFAMSNVTDHKGRSNDMLKKWAVKYNVIELDYDYKNASHNTVAKDSTEVLITNFRI
ncbi:Dam family site-specific DNA-(adenine-N6)-methyltransferase [Weissella cibaria]|uniref:Dam family site-specific DNA-(adenine-N6)-methyltransferase n=1 Tax=Weissella cibaria TaxID=137591 RepID=UPI001C2010C4|nr:Dam family site-specific DNA-(adenine-N6)-methyltransferase [Weissella cibaria]MBU7562367.1 Dam family site-specific DNA-(adenine-N6)-methyltransferase [Weissella cibaria]